MSSPAGAGSASAGATEAQRAVFLDRVRQSNSACQSGDFGGAVRLYTEALSLDPRNHILYSNRSAAHVKLGQFSAALADAVRARELSPQWPKVGESTCPTGSRALSVNFRLNSDAQIFVAKRRLGGTNRRHDVQKHVCNVYTYSNLASTPLVVGYAFFL